MKRMWWYGMGLTVALAVGGWAIRDNWYQDFMTKRNQYELAGNVKMTQQQVPVLQPDGSWRYVEQSQPPGLQPPPTERLGSRPIYAYPGGPATGSVEERPLLGPDGRLMIEQTTRQADGTQVIRRFPADGRPNSAAATDNQVLQSYLRGYQAAPEDSEQRAEMRAEIERWLSAQYDQHLSQHVQQVAELEARVTKLRQQLERRQAAKARLVELRLELMLSQADGLGWPEGPGGVELGEPNPFPPGTTSPSRGTFGGDWVRSPGTAPSGGFGSPSNFPGGLSTVPGPNSSALPQNFPSGQSRVPVDAVPGAPLPRGGLPRGPSNNFMPAEAARPAAGGTPFDRQGYSLPTEEARPIPVEPPATTPAPAAAPAVERQRPIPSTSAFTTDQDLASKVIKQAMLAVHNYHDAYQKLPFRHQAADDPQDHNDLSWLVRVLPYLDGGEEKAELFSQFDLSQGWDSPQNRPLLEKMPAILGQGPGSQTQLRWVSSDVKKFGDLTDGLSNTIALIHGGPAVNWTENKPLTQEEALELFLALAPGQELVVGMYDGSVRRLTRDNTTQATFEAMLTPNGGEQVPPHD